MLASELRNTADIDVSELSYEHVETEPLDRDWSEGWIEEWEWFAGAECEECETLVVVSSGGEFTCPNEDCESYDMEQSSYEEGPMMNYSYECSVNTEQAIELVHLPLCIIEFTDSLDTHLALTGGGMDLSWQICEAYMRLGYIPPTHYARLPAMAGRGTSDGDKRIIEACRESAKATLVRGQRTLDELDRIEQHAREWEAKN